MSGDPEKRYTFFSLRLRAVLVLLFVLGLLGTAACLDPARLEKPFASGYRLLTPCGFLYRTGYPCPTCYMTRAFAYMMHGRPDKAFLAQPFGALLCLMVIYLGVGAVQVLYTGKSWRPFWYQWSARWLLTFLVLAFLAGWIFRLGYGTFISGEFPLRH
jgi:hypothetical protein